MTVKPTSLVTLSFAEEAQNATSIAIRTSNPALIVDLCIRVRENMRASGRTEPNDDEALALVLISRSACQMSRNGTPVKDVCFLTKFEMDDYLPKGSKH